MATGFLSDECSRRQWQKLPAVHLSRTLNFVTSIATSLRKSLQKVLYLFIFGQNWFTSALSFFIGKYPSARMLWYLRALPCLNVGYVGHERFLFFAASAMMLLIGKFDSLWLLLHKEWSHIAPRHLKLVIELSLPFYKFDSTASYQDQDQYRFLSLNNFSNCQCQNCFDAHDFTKVIFMEFYHRWNR